MRPLEDWLATARTQLLHGDLTASQATLTHALDEYPASIDLRRMQAGVLRQSGYSADAEILLRELLRGHSGDAASAFALAHLLQEQGRMAAVAVVVRACLSKLESCDADLAINAIELLDDCGRKSDAAAVATLALSAKPNEPRLHAYAGMLQIQMGVFETARQHYLFALQRDERAWEWHVPLGLSSTLRYTSTEHPDFALFHGGLQRTSLSVRARAELHFALGKAYDDVGNWAEAAKYFRKGNTSEHQLTKWSRQSWRRAIEAKLGAPVLTSRAKATPHFTPIFVVGLPRTGTTLLSELLSRFPNVCNRGELPWLAHLAQRPALNGDVKHSDLQDASIFYAARARQDDAGNARWFIDKQPLNLRYVDLALALFPNARIIHCRRNARDNALSLWMQCFFEDVHGYCFQFDDIAQVMRDCGRLMALWCRRWPDSIRTIDYETLVATPDATVSSLAAWIGLSAQTSADSSRDVPDNAISTASLWQARQPVNTLSVGRWKHYAPHVPALLEVVPEI